MKRFDILIRCRRAFQFRSLKNNTQITAMIRLIYPNRNRLSVKRAKHELRRMKSSESPNRKGRSEWKKKKELWQKPVTRVSSGYFTCLFVLFFFVFFFPDFPPPLPLYTFQLSVVKSKFIISTNQSIREFLKEPTRSRCKNKLLEAR